MIPVLKAKPALRPRVAWDNAAATRFWAATCAEDFWWFVRDCYGIDRHPKGGWLSKEVHKPFCDWFQHHAQNWLAHRNDPSPTQTNLMIIVFREFGKTHLITRAGMAWLMLQDPELSIYIGSETLMQAKAFAKPLAGLLTGEDDYQRWIHYYGNWQAPDRQWGAEGLVHALRRGTGSQELSFGTWGAASGATGSHPDVRCLDDPTSYEGLEADREWPTKLMEHLASMIPVLKRNGLAIDIGTRYGDSDSFGQQLRLHGAKSISGMPMPGFTARPDGLYHVYFLAGRDLQGNPVLPVKWPDDAMRRYEKENNQKYWAQIMNSPGSSVHAVITQQQVEQLWVEPRDVPKNLRISFHIDTAFKYHERKRRGDYSVIQIWGHTRDGSGDVYFLEGYCSNRWRAEDFNSRLVALLQRYRADGRWPFILTDEMETGGKGGTWELTLASWCHAANIPCPRVVLIPRQGKSKERRFSEAMSYWVDGHAKLVRGAPGVDQLVEQVLAFDPQYDDQRDPACDVFHKEVYQPLRLQSRDMLPTVIGAEEDVGTVHLSDLKRRYAMRGLINGPLPPIGNEENR